MKRPGKKGMSSARAPGEMTSVEPTPSGAAAKGIGVGDTLGETTPVELAQPDNLSGSGTVAEGVNTADTLAAAHVELTVAFGILLTMPEVELALRQGGRWYDARNMFFRHQELARTRGES